MNEWMNFNIKLNKFYVAIYITNNCHCVLLIYLSRSLFYSRLSIPLILAPVFIKYKKFLPEPTGTSCLGVYLHQNDNKIMEKKIPTIILNEN